MSTNEAKEKYLRSLLFNMKRDGWLPVAWDFDDYSPAYRIWAECWTYDLIEVDKARILEIGPELDRVILAFENADGTDGGYVWLEFTNEMSEWLSNYSGSLCDTLDAFADKFE